MFSSTKTCYWLLPRTAAASHHHCCRRKSNERRKSFILHLLANANSCKSTDTLDSRVHSIKHYNGVFQSLTTTKITQFASTEHSKIDISEILYNIYHQTNKMMKVSMSSSSLMGSHSNNGFKFSEDYGEEVIVQKPAAESEQRGFLASWLFKKRFSTASQHTESTYHMNSDSSFDERSSTSSEDNVGLFLEVSYDYYL